MRWSSMAAAALLTGLLLAGCANPPASLAGTTTTAAAPVATLYEVRCRLQDTEQRSLAGTCAYDFPGYSSTAVANANGTASLRIAKGLQGTVTGAAPGHADSRVSLVVDGPKSIRFTLGEPPSPPDGSHPAGTTTVQPGTSTSITSAGTSGNDTVPMAPVGPARTWGDPVVVEANGAGSEPQLAIDAQGTIYYAPASAIYRSLDGGQSFSAITPGLPTLGSDDTLSVAPDGSLWWADYYLYANTVQACTSTTQGSSWTCDYTANPGVNDRMWIVGLSATEGYLQSGQALEVPEWDHTTLGSLKYVPYAEGASPLVGQLGNMVYDAKHKAVWQLEDSQPQGLIRVDGATGTLSARGIGIDDGYAITTLAVQDGVLWTTSERNGEVYAARSTDQGQTWQTFRVSQQPALASFSYIAAGPDGRAAVVYLGSDKGGQLNPNGGTWSLYVAETGDALAASPTWVESQVVAGVHRGNLCIGLNCEQTGGDSKARMEGDLIGIALDAQGNAHVSYVQDNGDQQPAMYLREHLA